MNEHIEKRVARFPTGPGVYIFTGVDGSTLYVGKASNLRARVRQYLRPGGDGRWAMPFLQSEAADVEFLATTTEQEALLLEGTLAKKRKPKYNVKLKDDKSFLMLRLDRREDWPWFRLVRRRKRDGARYFGPYASAKSVRRTLRLLHKIVPLRDCRDAVFNNRSRPCIKHQIGRCPAPCVDLVERAAYDELLDQAVEILSGRVGPILERLRDDMDRAAAELAFERAQARKLQIEALCRVAERQDVVSDAVDQDAVGLHRVGDEVTAVFLLFRAGVLESSRRFTLRSRLEDGLLIEELLRRFYDGDRYVPREVLVPEVSGGLAEAEMLIEWLADKRGARVDVTTPKRGPRRRHLEMAIENAKLSDAMTADEDSRRREGLARLQKMLQLPAVPARIHCLDVSTIQGTSTVASRVAFRDGSPDRKQYRRYRISGKAAGDDFSSMEEAVRRSLTRCMTDERDELPDLLIVDGGQGQLAAAVRAVDDLGLRDDVPLVGLAKSRLKGLSGQRARTSERLFLPEQAVPMPLADGAPETLIVTYARDEAHRFAITYHRSVRGKLSSALDDIPGVGPGRRRALLRHLGSLSAVQAASIDELARTPGLSRALAERIHATLRATPEAGPPRADNG